MRTVRSLLDFLVHPRKTVEDGKMARLEDAEQELQHLRIRADRAIATLNQRRAQNHWRESIERLIRGEYDD